MSAGTLIDYRRGSAHPSEWVDSPPQISMWTGKVKNELRYEVSAYRCDGCGLLKLYASDPASGPGNIYG
jgi:hypothetical protein